MEVQEKALYTVAQAAELLSRSAEGVRRLVRRGELPGRRIGRRVYILGSDLLRAGTQEAGEAGPVSVPESRPKGKGKKGAVLKAESAGDRWRALAASRN